MQLSEGGWRAYGKVGHVGDEDVHLDDLRDRGAGFLKDSLEVRDAGPCLLLDRTADEVSLGVARDLAGAVDGRRGLDGLRLKIGERGSLGINGTLGCQVGVGIRMGPPLIKWKSSVWPVRVSRWGVDWKPTSGSVLGEHGDDIGRHFAGEEQSNWVSKRQGSERAGLSEDNR